MSAADTLARRAAAEQAAAVRRIVLKRQLRALGITFPDSARYDEAALRALVPVTTGSAA